MADLAWLGRTTLLVGAENVQKLQNAHVLVVGLGGGVAPVPSSAALLINPGGILVEQLEGPVAGLGDAIA